MATDESIKAEIESRSRSLQAKVNEMKYAYVIGGISIVLLIIGWANYEEGPLGFLAFLGVVGLFIAAVGYFTTRSEINSRQQKIDELRAIQEDRRQRSGN